MLPMQSVHPLIVHFPIALLIASLLFECLAWVFRIEAWRLTARWCLVAGALGAAASVWSGLRAEAVAKHSFEIHQVMNLHKKLGISVLATSSALSVWWLVSLKWKIPFQRIVYLILLAGVVSVLGFGAYLGGRLVYEFDVGKITVSHSHLD
ncbi:MAG: DUF2231 domain-containing protein [Candidatus Omnitrophica bacterium]|nr:DUF2231 domain-containing protein [Candidatus Omnitrophota bacterium]